jgi:hypothetical protein
MEALGELLSERPIDHPVNLDATLAPKRLGFDPDAEMGLAAGPVAGVTGVEMRLVDHLERGRPKSFG